MPYFHTADGLKLYYETFGQEGPPLVLLHGLSSSTQVWAPQIPALQAHFRLYSFDYPGHGHSQWTRQYSLQQLSHILKEFMDAMALEQAHLLGLSVGCDVALFFACHYPQRVLSLILEGPSGGITPYHHPKGWLKFLLISLYLLILYTAWKLLGREKTAYLINRYGPQTLHYSPLLESLEREVDPRAVWQLTYENGYPPYVKHLHTITAPTLIIRGRTDGFPRRYSLYLQDHLGGPCQFVEIPNGRHVVALDQPHPFNQAVIDFLTHLPS